MTRGLIAHSIYYSAFSLLCSFREETKSGEIKKKHRKGRKELKKQNMKRQGKREIKRQRI